MDLRAGIREGDFIYDINILVFIIYTHYVLFQYSVYGFLSPQGDSRLYDSI